MSDARSSATALRDIPVMSWVVLSLMTVDYALGMIDRNAVSILKTTLKAVFQVNDGAYGLLVTAFMIPYAICYILCGWIVDRWGTRWPFALFVGTWSVATIGCGLATNFSTLVAWRVVLGMAEAGLLPVTIVALVKWFPRDRMAFAYAVKTPFQSLGAILSPPIVASLTIAYSWRAGFLVPGAIGLVFAALWVVADRNPPQFDGPAEDAGPRPTIRSLLRSRVLWGIMIARLISDPVWFFFQYWQAGYMQERLGASLAQVGSLLWLPPLVTAVATFFTAYASDRSVRRGGGGAIGRIRVMQVSAVLGPLIATLAFIGGVPWFLIVVTTSYLLGFTWLYLSNILMADLFPKPAVGTALGLMSCVGTGGAALFNLAAGPVIVRFGYAPIFILMACLHPAAAIVLQIFYRHGAGPAVRVPAPCPT